MEVHHHSHHPKNWKEYFTEFLMLFLAVSLGFLAENIREVYIEKERSHELAQSLLSDIENDEERMKTFLKDRSEIMEGIKLIILDVKDKGIIDDDPEQYRLFARSAFYWSYFEPKTANLEQIINSGSLRYFKRKQVVEAVSVYKTAITNLLARQEREKVFFYSTLQPFILNNINLEPMDTTSITGSMPVREYFQKLSTKEIQLKKDKFLFVEKDEETIRKIINMYRFYSVVLHTTYRNYYTVYLNRSKELAKILKEEMH